MLKYLFLLSRKMILEGGFMQGFISKDSAAFKGKQVVLYTIPNSPECKAAKEFLFKRGVKFEEADVTRSAAALEEMLKFSPSGRPPVLMSSGSAINGFDAAKFAFLLSV